MKKIISFSVYGNNPRYITGCKKQCELIAQLLPDWTAWIYTDQPQNFADCPAEVFAAPSSEAGSFWRFQPFWQPDTWCLIRDADSRFTEREVKAIREWETSRCRMHVIRDHEWHYNKPMMAGLSGIKGPLPHSLKILFDKIITDPNQNAYAKDEEFLQDHVWPLFKDDVLIHDSAQRGWFRSSRQRLQCATDFCGNGYTHDDYAIYAPTASGSIEPHSVKFQGGLLNPPRIQIFLFNWPGQTSRALTTEKQLYSLGYNVTVINSDPGYTPYNWINLGNSAWFSAQWRMATSLFNADIMFHIQADATYSSWQTLIQDALKYFDVYNYGIYSPGFLDNGHYVPLQTWKSQHDNIHAIPNPDCTCWFIHRDIIDQFKNLNLDLNQNHFGWGIDCVVCAVSWTQGRIVLRDLNHTVTHHPGRGYTVEDARNQMNAMLTTLDPALRKAIDQQYSNKESLLEYLQQDLQTLLHTVKYYADNLQHDLACFHAQKLMADTHTDSEIWAEAAQILSINAFYTTAYRELGREICEYLATCRHVPSHIRHLARNNNVYYAKPLADIAPSWRAASLNFATEQGWLPMNPSVCSYQDKIYMIQRTVNYIVDKEGSYIANDARGYADTRNYFVELDHDMNIVSRVPILHPENHPAPAWPLVQGFEDSRLFFSQGEPWCSSTVRDQNGEGIAEIVLTKLVNYQDHYKLTDYHAIEPDFCPKTYEKNWMPVVRDNQLQFIYSSDPVRVVDSQGHLVCEHPVGRAVDNFRGGYVVKDLEQGYLAVIHESSIHGTLRRYLHRFVWYDENMCMGKYSDAFYLTQLGLEFVAGLTRHPVTQDLIVSFGVGDSSSWLGTISPLDVGNLLKYRV